MAANSSDSYDRLSELKAFDETKAGVKGLVDSGINKIPRFFIHHDDESSNICNAEKSGNVNLKIPVIDLQGLINADDPSLRRHIVEQVGEACEKWGFFQLINHGIPQSVLDGMIDGIRRSHEQDSEEKKKFYSRDDSKKVFYNTNFNLYQAKSANWRDSLNCFMAPNPPHPLELPSVCREIIIDYSNRVMELGKTLLELMSEALGLNPNHLKEMGCADGIDLIGQYYPDCPEPALTFGANEHTDKSFLTVLLQDQVGGLQVLHQDQWLHVNPMYGDLVVNVGDLSQVIANVGPRTSIASFIRLRFGEDNCSSKRVFGPIEQLVSEENPPIYRKITARDYPAKKYQHATSGLQCLKL